MLMSLVMNRFTRQVLVDNQALLKELLVRNSEMELIPSPEVQKTTNDFC